VADFQPETKSKVNIRFDQVLPAGTVVDITKDGISLPGFPKTVPTGKEFDAVLKVQGVIRDEP